MLLNLLSPHNSWGLVTACAAGLAVVAYVIRTVADVMGWSPSQATLRDANDDLRQRNTDLETTQTRDRLTITAQAETIRSHEQRIKELENQVREMKTHDVSALHAMMVAHEHNAGNRAQTAQGLLERIASALETPRS